MEMEEMLQNLTHKMLLILPFYCAIFRVAPARHGRAGLSHPAAPTAQPPLQAGRGSEAVF